MAYESVKMKDVVDRSVTHTWSIPEFQRGFVWKPTQVRDLAESLWLDYPIGSLLVWNSQEQTEERIVRDAQRPTLWVVDGQQRATALLILFGRKPYWWTADWEKTLRKYDIRFNIDAKASFPAKMDQMMKMLGPLLEERFQLKVHRETRDVPGFALVVAKGGPKMAASDQPGVGSWRERRNEITSFSLDMKMLAYILAGSLGSPVADATGLTGTYDFTLDYSTERGATAGPSVPPSAPDLAVALRQQLGLQLVRKKEPFDVVVVDAVDKMPTAN